MTDRPTTPDAAPTHPLDLSRPRRIHLVGVGGSGMNAIASVLAEMGHEVSGSDLRHSAGFDRCIAHGVRAVIGHDAANLGEPPPDAVAASTAIGLRNPELVAAREHAIPVLSRAEVLSAIAARKQTISVAGTHGKTTTSSMLALALVRAGAHPSFIIGGDVNEIGSGAVWDDDGELFVVEADESDGTFLALASAAAVVTNVEPDHLDHYGSVRELHDAFARFTAGVSGPVVLPADDPVGAGLPAERALTFGWSETADVRASGYRGDRAGCHFELTVRGEGPRPVRLGVPGRHNAANATAAIAMAVELGASIDDAIGAMARFGGVSRRFEHRGSAGGVAFIDDYAHLPTEVAAALDAAADGGFDRIVCVFQPHRYSRTAAVADDLADAFVTADVVVITDVYPAGEKARPGVTGHLVERAVRRAHPEARVIYAAQLADAEEVLAAELAPGDLCLTLGAGDLTLLPDRMIERLGGVSR